VFIALGILAAVLSIIVSAAFRDLGYKSGLKDGHQNGYAAAIADAQAHDVWWLDAEKQVVEAREKIWREEAQL